MKIVVLLLLTAPLISKAAPILELETSHPYKKCVVSESLVAIEKQVGGLRYSKSTSFTIDSRLKATIETVYNQNHTSNQNNEYWAYYSAADGENKKFALTLNKSKESESLIRFLVQICND